MTRENTGIQALKGKTIIEIDGLHEGCEEVIFRCADSTEYLMFHKQDCCESVSIEQVTGDPADLIGNEILVAEESTSDTNPDGVVKKDQESYTWTFYKLATIKGYVDIRWYGESNGFYSESVDFKEVKL